jgi:hypothetical protein
LNIVVATTSGDLFGGVFARAYRAAGGPSLASVVLLPERADLTHPFWAQPWVAFRLLGVVGTLRMARVRAGLLSEAEKAFGWLDRWPDALADAGTSIEHWDSLGTGCVDQLRAMRPDVLVSIGVPHVIPPQVLAVPQICALNIHNGLLPNYRGHFATFWEAMAGESEGGITIHLMTEKVDQGKIIGEARVGLTGRRSLLDVMLEKKHVGGALLARVLTDLVQSGCVPQGTPLVSHQGSYYGWPTLRDVARFRFSVPA